MREGMNQAGQQLLTATEKVGSWVTGHKF